MKRYHRTREAAKILKCSTGFLHNQRYLFKKGLWKGPFLPFIRRGKSILYDEDDLIAYMESQKVGSIDK